MSMPKVIGRHHPRTCNGIGRSWNGMNIPVRNWKARLKKPKIAVTCLYCKTKAANIAPNCDSAATESIVANKPREIPVTERVSDVNQRPTQNIGMKKIVDCTALAAMLLTIYH